MKHKRIKVRLTKNSPYSDYGYYKKGDIGYIDGYVNDSAVIILENGKFAKSDLGWIEVVNEEDDEQNPADNVEPKFHEGDIIIHKELGGDYIHNPHKIIQVDILDKKYRLEGGLVAHFGEQEDYELVEQKPAVWSEEDESRMDNMCHFLEEYGNQYYGYLTLQGTISWLKSLRPQSQWKPSAFHLECIEDAISLYEKRGSNPIGLKEILDELKKLREE